MSCSRRRLYVLLYLPGSCWAVAVTDAVAAAHAILTPSKRAPFLNYTQILALAPVDERDACGGGNPWRALSLLSNASSTGDGLASNVSEVSVNCMQRSCCGFMLQLLPRHLQHDKTM